MRPTAAKCNLYSSLYARYHNEFSERVQDFSITRIFLKLEFSMSQQDSQWHNVKFSKQCTHSAQINDISLKTHHSQPLDTACWL